MATGIASFPNGLEDLTRPFSLAFGTLLPSVALERAHIERLTLALVVAAPQFRDEPQNLLECPVWASARLI
jgi:hypothetical protein